MKELPPKLPSEAAASAAGGGTKKVKKTFRPTFELVTKDTPPRQPLAAAVPERTLHASASPSPPETQPEPPAAEENGR